MSGYPTLDRYANPGSRIEVDIVGFPQCYTTCMSLFGEVDDRKFGWIPDPKETSIRVLDEVKKRMYGWVFGRGPARWLTKEPQAGAFEICFVDRVRTSESAAPRYDVGLVDHRIDHTRR